MKLPRDVNGKTLVKRLERLGYQLSWTTGSHMICTLTGNSSFRVSIPAHNPLRVGTFAMILTEISLHTGYNRQELLTILEL